MVSIKSKSITESYSYENPAPPARHHPHHRYRHCWSPGGELLPTRSLPPTLICTAELRRCGQTRTAYDHCGNAYCYQVLVSTLQDHYSDGSTQLRTVTYRA